MGRTVRKKLSDDAYIHEKSIIFLIVFFKNFSKNNTFLHFQQKIYKKFILFSYQKNLF